MNCPFCKSILSKVVDKRAVSGRGEIRRRRECLKCGKRFTTYESLAKLQIMVVKKDGRKEPYSQEKMRVGLLKALKKRPGIDKVDKIIDRIEGKVKFRGLKEIPSVSIGKWILTELKKIDPIAYLRFASVYHAFGDPRDFEKEIKNLS